MENSGAGDNLGLVLFLCAAVAGMPALLVLLTALVPGYAERTRAVIHKWPGRSFLLGFVNILFFFALAMFSEVEFAPIALVGQCSLAIVLPILLVAGLLGATGVVGERVWQQISPKGASLLGSLAIGIVVMGLALIMPIVGWILSVILVCIGLGASIIALFRRKPSQMDAAEPEVEKEQA
jgi:hypothetical protein